MIVFQGPVSLSDFRLEKCPPEPKTPAPQTGKNSDLWMEKISGPKWQQLIAFILNLKFIKTAPPYEF